MQGKTAEIICVGTELLMGSTLPTNATEIAAALAGIGLNLSSPPAGWVLPTMT